MNRPPKIEPCDGGAEHNWEDREFDCEVCGSESHAGIICRICLETVDLVFFDDPRLA